MRLDLQIPPLHMMSVEIKKKNDINKSHNETESMSFIQTPRGYTMRSVEKPIEHKLYSTQNSPRISEPAANLENKTDINLAIIEPDISKTNKSLELKKKKPPKLYRDLNKVEDIMDEFEIKQEKNAAIRFGSSDEKLKNILKSK